MATLIIRRVLVLPEVLEANAMYIVQGPDNLAEVVFTGMQAEVTKKIIDKATVAQMIANATTSGADKLTTARLIEGTGDATFQVVFDGSEDVSGAITLAETGVVAGTYPKVTVDAKGRVTGGSALQQADIPSLDGDKIVSDLSVNTTGNAATATALQTPRTINGVSFDGTEDIVINAVDATPRIAVSEKGAANGVATLDANGLVPSNQLPSFVDDVIEAATFEDLPAEGEQGKIYVVLGASEGARAGDVFRWSGSIYVKVSDAVSTADTAETLATAREIAIAGDAAGAASFDGSQNISIEVTLASVGTAGEQAPVVTTDAKGRVVGSRALVEADIPVLSASKVAASAGVDLGTPEW